MTTKKKPAAPAPLLKLKFEKFPDKPVPVFFDAGTRQFTAKFGFGEYSAPSVSALEQKIKNAIKAGATPDTVWVPVILVSDDGGTYDPVTPGRLYTQCQFEVERKYIALGKSGIVEVAWDVPEKMRSLRSQENYWLNRGSSSKPKVLPKLPYVGGEAWNVALPYSDDLWDDLRSAFLGWQQIVAAARKAMKAGDAELLIEAFTLVIREATKLSPAAGALTGAKKPRAAVSHTTDTPDRARSVSKQSAVSTQPSAKDAPAPEGRNKVAQGVSPGKAKKKASPGGAAQNEKAARALFHRLIADGPLDPAWTAKLGYPPGTTVVISGNNVDIKPPHHVAMLYSRKWLADRMARADAGEDFSAPPPLFSNGAEQTPAEVEP